MMHDVTPNTSTFNNNNSHPQTNPEDTEHPNINIKDIKLDTKDWTKIQYTTRHKIFISTEKTDLKKRSEKKKEIENLIPGYIRIIGSDIKFSDEDMYIKIDFPSAADKIAAVEHLDKTNIQWKTNISSTDQTTTDRKSEIIVRDIPLEITEEDICRQFTQYGDIRRIVLKVNRAWQTANVIFHLEDSVRSNFQQKWSDIIRKDSVRIYPAEDYEHTKQTRDQFCAKLCNLPRNTTGFDIADYITQVKGKTCFIPRTKVQYGRVRYAYVNFETKEDLEAVLTSQEAHYIRNFNIFWTTTDTKTCHICQSRDHLAAVCPRLQDKTKNEKRISKLAELYTRKRLNIPSTKNVIKKAANIKKQKTYSQAAQEGIETNIQAKSIEDRLSKVEKLLDTALFTIQEIINKGIVEENRAELQKEIFQRNQQNHNTPSRPPNPPKKQNAPTNTQDNTPINTQ